MMTDTILEMRHISKAFAGVQALRDVSFACRKGEVQALVGENGAGKSTLMKILAGVHQSDSGEIVYKGSTYRHFTPREALDKGIVLFIRNWHSVLFIGCTKYLFRT